MMTERGSGARGGAGRSWLTCGVELHEAARRLGVHYHTAYRWVREGTLAAVKRGTAYEIEPDEVERHRAARHAPVPPPRVTVVRDWSQQVGRLYDALAGGDELAARAVVDRLTDGGIGPVAIITELLTPALQEIGARWASGSLSIAEEHRASAICERLLARIAVHPRGRPRGVAVVATAPSDDHALPAAMAALALRADRWQVHHLGPRVPAGELAAFAGAVGAHIVVISTTTSTAEVEVVDLRRMLTPGPVVLAGRPGRTVVDLLAEARAARGAAR